MSNKYKFQIHNFKTVSIGLLVFICIYLYLFVFIGNSNAQDAISLSVSPPLFELTIQPGKSIKQIFNITNLGGDTIITPKITYFEPADEIGNINLTEDLSPDWVIYDKKPFKLNGQAKLDFEVKFSPSDESPETDHFLTLVFETNEAVNLLNQNSTNYKSRIGTNILLTISKDGNPKKSAEIVEFSAPKFVDSLYAIRYTLILANNGNSFWKPNGKIIVNDEILKLAPQNILSGNSRIINCIDNENLINCKLKSKFRIGKIVSKLEFSIDEDAKIYQMEAVTYVFPFSILVIFLTLLTTLKFKSILILWRKIKR